jgi:hypothetical protein
MKPRRGWRSVARARSQRGANLSFEPDGPKRTAAVKPERSVEQFQDFLAALAPPDNGKKRHRIGDRDV